MHILIQSREHAILVVTTSLEKLAAQIPQAQVLEGSLKGFDLKDLANDPNLKQMLQRNSRDAIVLLDKALKHPVVITGVSQFAKSKGIPHADALFRLASLGLSKILNAIPEETKDSVLGQELRNGIAEIDAAELERRSTMEERDEAAKVGKVAETTTPAVEIGDPYAELRKKNECNIM